MNTTPDYGPVDFSRELGVARETVSRLSTYVDLLCKKNEQLNLVAESTLQQVWRRHILDSAQLAELIPKDARTLVDLGSGAGFPGLVLAIMLSGRPGLVVHLVESIQKKCRFLDEVAAATGAPVQVHWTRAEALPGLKADIVTARAVAPLEKLLTMAYPFFRPRTIGLFLKGKSVSDELTLASKSWTLDSTPIPSRSDPSGTVLRVTGLSPWRKPKRPS
ncbi:MAG: 16S rRNA (guanine(527)-N(7))-methyltransferase RsmG [Micropepsaceae bacterium]